MTNQTTGNMKKEPIHAQLLSAQRNEISEYHTYQWLARRLRDQKNQEILNRIAREELGHYEILKKITQTDAKPHWLRVFWFRLISRVLGLSFGLKLMERGESIAQGLYTQLKTEVPEISEFFRDEHRHEAEILDLIKEERIKYASSMVLGLNDALMELTGVLSGLTFALQNGKMIAMAGFITGIAASMSMSASAFLSSREEADHDNSKNPLKSAAYTGFAYVITVFILISPYLLLSNVYASLLIMLSFSILIILSYNFYITTAKRLPLWRRFSEMAVISLSVAGISFLIGILARKLFGIEV